jgi:hypothetical protein
MSLSSSYTDFGTSLASWLLDDKNATITDVGVNMVADLILVGESRMNREVRNVDMETSFGSTISGGVLALPSSYLELKSSWVDTSPQVTLERRNAEWIRTNYPQNSGSGIPQFIARYGQNFIFGPYPDSAYTINGIYYKRPTGISGAALNTLFTNNPDLYLFACLSKGSIVIGDSQSIQLWEAQYQKILADVNGAGKAEDASGSSLQMRLARSPTYRPVAR